MTHTGYLAKEIAAQRFYKRPGRWCSWCDYLPLCMGDKARTAETLMRVSPGPRWAFNQSGQNRPE